MYDLLRAALFRLPEELSHQFTLSGLDACQRLGLLSRLAGARVPDDPRGVFGLRFPNPVGLAAGLDKNADHLDSLGALGFGFIEVGTVTPKPQPGNEQPRLFRLPEQRAIINRMGFNNKGLDHLVARIAKRRYRGVLGVNIGKNVFTPVERAVDDYLACLRGVYAHADYVVVNLSSPNTPGLRSLQFGAPLDELLSELKREQAALRESQQRQVPLLLKIAPDLADEEIRQIAGSLLRHGVEGVIATNTTVEREAVREARHGQEAGGLSGAPLRAQALRVTRVLHEALGGALPIIGVGGIESGQAARERVAAGASLVQVYTGFIYRGPGLLREIAEALRGIDAARAAAAPSREQTP